MKLKLFAVVFLFYGSVAWGQSQVVDTNIDQTHRGYDIRTNATGHRPAPPEPPFTPPTNIAANQRFDFSMTRPENIRKYLLNIGLGYFYTGTMDYGAEFDMPGSPWFSLSFTTYLTRYFGVGAGVSYNSNTSKDLKINEAGSTTTLTLSYTTIAPNLFMSYRYPLPEYDHIEPYINFGLTYNMNSFEYKDKSATTDTTVSTSGGNFGFEGELGLRWIILKKLQTGVALRYTYNRQDVKDSNAINMDGITVFITIGYFI